MIEDTSVASNGFNPKLNAENGLVNKVMNEVVSWRSFHEPVRPIRLSLHESGTFVVSFTYSCSITNSRELT